MSKPRDIKYNSKVGQKIAICIVTFFIAVTASKWITVQNDYIENVSNNTESFLIEMPEDAFTVEW
jgi:hypothetical protein